MVAGNDVCDAAFVVAHLVNPKKWLAPKSRWLLGTKICLFFCQEVMEKVER